MPSVNKNESRKDFVSRCIPILIKEGKEQDQAVAICNSMYDEHTKAETEKWASQTLGYNNDNSNN